MSDKKTQNISFGQVNSWFRRFGEMNKNSDKQFDALDTNKDGKVDEAEWSKKNPDVPFWSIDTNWDGSIDKKELQKFEDTRLDLDELTQKLGEKRAKSWMKNMDLSGNGFVEKNEMVAFFASRETGKSQADILHGLDTLKLAFDFVDILNDKWQPDGFNDKGELRTFLQLAGQNPTDETLDAIIFVLDQKAKNHPLDKKVDFQEVAFFALEDPNSIINKPEPIPISDIGGLSNPSDGSSLTDGSINDPFADQTNSSSSS